MNTHQQRGLRGIGAVLLLFGAMSALGAASDSGKAGGAKDPGGNNGFVEVEGEEISNPPNNQPHVDCDFLVEFYNYDEGATYNAEVLLEFQPPTTRPKGSSQVIERDTVFIGQDPAGGGDDLDAREPYDLRDELASSGVQPHAKQGYKVKLTVRAAGSKGSDRKHKVFWVKCSEPPTTTTIASTTTTTVAPTTTTTVAPTTVTTAGGTTVTSQPSVQGITQEPTTTTSAPAVVQGIQEVDALPRTGLSGNALFAGLASMLAGLTCLGLGRRRR